MHDLLAQTPAALQTQSIFFWAGVLLAVSACLIVAGVVLYRRFNGPDDVSDPVGGFTLEDLRVLHQQGRLTDEEFNLAREKLLAGFPTGSPPAQGPDNSAKPGQPSSEG